MPLPMICSRAARRATDGMAASSPAMDPIWIQVKGAVRSARAVSRGSMTRADWSPPHVVDHDVGVSGSVDRVVGDRLVRAESGERREPGGVASGGAHLGGAEKLACRRRASGCRLPGNPPGMAKSVAGAISEMQDATIAFAPHNGFRVPIRRDECSTPKFQGQKCYVRERRRVGVVTPRILRMVREVPPYGS
ncbi:hypothetical protein [Actinoplanes sp. NPDC026623]|uniref:hypothetical protein n=1 Tax=Actinoplanes sp. NPDC026623 TaxID=3155610 RepID=UPI0033DFABE4